MPSMSSRSLTAGLILIVAGLAGCQSLQAGLASMAAEAGSAEGIVVGVRDGETRLRSGQTLAIALPSNGSTGYAWRLAEFDSAILARGEPFGNEVTNAHPVGTVGVPGETRWQFRATARGQTTLVFAYARPWEAGTRPAETARYTVTVR
jgi:inhibitor of cysteine peptidase